MRERREYLRLRILARVRLHALAGDRLEAARDRVRTHYVTPALACTALEDTRVTAETRAELDLLRHIAVSLVRIERRLDALASREPADTALPIPVSISASGFSTQVGNDLEVGTSVWVEFVLEDGSVPDIPAVATVVGRSDEGTAFRFEEISSEDRERIIQLAIRSQSQALRAERIGEAR